MRLAELPYWARYRMLGECPPDEFESDGCTLSPDRWRNADLRPACHWHDWAYFRGGSALDRAIADVNFYFNLRRCGLGLTTASLYYHRVRLWGVRHFRWADAPPRFWVFNLIGRYLPIPGGLCR